MKRPFSLLICILMFAGCVDEVRLRYDPALEGKRLAPINLNTDIKVESIVLKGYITEVSSREDYYDDGLFRSGHYFTSLKEDIEEAIEKDLRYDLFPLENASSEIFVNVKAKFTSNYAPLRHKDLIFVGTNIACDLGCLFITYPQEDDDALEVGMSWGCASMLWFFTTGCIWASIGHTVDKVTASTWVFCDILDKNKKSIASYETEIKREKRLDFIRSKGNPTARQILQSTLSEALSDIKSQINRDREKILEAARD